MSNHREELATRLARIAAEMDALAADLAQAGGRPTPEGASARARRLLAERRARQACLPREIDAEPAWAMLLALFAEGEHAPPMSAKALAIAASAPASTAQRWLDQLAAAELVTRATDAADRRRVELALTGKGRALVARCLAALASG